MGYVEYPPSPALCGSVRCFWSIHDEPSEKVQEVWPDACVELVFSLGNNSLVNADGSSQLLPKVFVLGLQTQILRVRTEGEVRLLGARMLPSGIRNWRPVDLIPLGAEIEEHLQAGEFEVAASSLEAWLLRQPALEDTVTLALRRLYAAAGNVSIAELAASQGVSSRQLQRMFAARCGVSPKALARLVRFAQSWSRLLDRPNLSLAELALELGYCDQAHLNHEFSSFGKQSPRAFSTQWSKVSPFYKTD